MTIYISFHKRSIYQAKSIVFDSLSLLVTNYFLIIIRNAQWQKKENFCVEKKCTKQHVNLLKRFGHKKAERWGGREVRGGFTVWGQTGFYWTVTAANVRASSGGQRYEETPSISQITYISGQQAHDWIT